MIICSCNILSEDKIKECLMNKERQPSVGSIFKELGCPPVCGSCANNIVKLVREHYESLHRPV